MKQEEIRDIKSDMRKMIKRTKLDQMLIRVNDLEAVLNHAAHLEYCVSKERAKIRELEARIEDIAAI